MLWKTHPLAPLSLPQHEGRGRPHRLRCHQVVPPRADPRAASCVVGTQVAQDLARLGKFDLLYVTICSYKLLLFAIIYY